MDISLILVQKDQRQKEIKLSKDRTTIGRSTECTIRIPVASVSRKHCELVLDDDELVLIDHKSGNGTWVNQKRVQEHVCSPGDLIAVGPAVFVVRIDGEPKSVNAEGALKAGLPPEPMASTPAAPSVVTKMMPQPASAPANPGVVKHAPAEHKGGSLPAKPPVPKGEDDDLDESSLSDFDFLDDKDDDQPKL